MIRKVTVVLALALGLAGCELDRVGFGPPVGGERPDLIVPDDPDVRLLEFNANTGFGDARRLVVEDEGAWAEVWSTWTGSVAPAPQRPDVDFDEERVVVATMGGRPTGGYSIGVESVERRAGEVAVRLFTVEPGQGCYVTQAVTYPGILVAIPAGDDPVRFTTTHYVSDCDAG